MVTEGSAGDSFLWAFQSEGKNYNLDGRIIGTNALTIDVQRVAAQQHSSLLVVCSGQKVRQ